MLDTLLQIGKTLRNSESGKIRHHRYIKSAPLADKKTRVIYWSVPVNEDFEIQFDRKSELNSENQIKNSLFYLGFKSGEADSLVKYIFGDISYGRDKNGKELGYYRMKNAAVTNAFGLSSFVRGIEDAKFFNGTIIEKFRKSFERNIDEIESFLQEQANEQMVFLHFDFGGKSWYEFEDELKEINRKLLEDFLGKQKDFFVLRKYIYKTLISSSSSLPSFDAANAYKTRAFESQDEVMNLLYSLDYSKKALVSERDIKVIVLPKGEHLEAKSIEDFFERGKSDEPNATDLANIANQKKQEKTEIEDDGFGESLFKPILDKVDRSITQYDFIFSKKGSGASTPDVDMLELSGIERSFLSQLNERIRRLKQSELLQERTKNYEGRKIPKQFIGYDIRRSFLNILGDVTTDKKKYQSHLFKVLPQIYAGNYFRDDVILPAFIEKVEFNIRSDTPNYNLLKYDYYFLVKIRNKNGEKDMEDMKTSESYQAGLLLGKMAQPLRREINSFEKNYVGLLSRRITDKQGLVKFMNFINEKLIIHDVAYRNLRESSVELAKIVNELDEKLYRKNYCAFGFFEGYFTFNKQSEQSPETENQEENQ